MSTATLDLCTCFPQLLQQLPAERVEQKEIPAEHMVLKSTFDSLVQRCQLAAGDPVSLIVGLWHQTDCICFDGRTTLSLLNMK